MTQSLYNKIEQLGLKISDKAKISLEIAAKQSRAITSDKILLGLINSNSPISIILEDNGIDLIKLESQIKRNLYRGDKPIPPYIFNDFGFSNEFDKEKYEDYQIALNRYNNLPSTDEIESEDLVLNTILRNVDGAELNSEMLSKAIIKLPNCWYILNKNNVSANKIGQYYKRLNLFESDVEVQKLVITTEGNQFKVLPYDIIGISNYSDAFSADNKLIKIYSTDLNKFIYADQVLEFEWLINKTNVSEHDLQKFFEKNPGFLLNMEYKNLYSQITLERQDLPNLRPDFMLERIDYPLCDIVDLKKPNINLVVGSKNRRTFSHQVTSVLSQLSTYRDYFDNPIQRKMFYNKYGFEAFKPKISVIIGRSNSFVTPIERKNIEMLFPSLNILTYDDILLKARYNCLR